MQEKVHGKKFHKMSVVQLQNGMPYNRAYSYVQFVKVIVMIELKWFFIICIWEIAGSNTVLETGCSDWGLL